MALAKNEYWAVWWMKANSLASGNLKDTRQEAREVADFVGEMADAKRGELGIVKVRVELVK